jgi:branched-chain amino acid transport system ATP-binding protein
VPTGQVAMLRISGLNVSYGNIRALRDLDLEVEAGEIVGLIGPNGAGKSTTLSTVMGLTAPTAGSVTFEGREIVGRRPERIVTLGLGLVPEGRHIFGTLTVRENLLLGATPRRDRSALPADLDDVCDRFPVLRTYLGSPAWRMSGGEQQQLAIARALLARPRLLMLDEPSLGLAPLVIDTVFDSLKELREEGVTILLVEQNAARTVELADRTYVLKTGVCIAQGTRDQVLDSAEIREMYLGPG